MKTEFIELDVDYVGSQDPADQPTAEDLAAISRYIQAQKQQRVEVIQQELQDQKEALKKVA